MRGHAKLWRSGYEHLRLWSRGFVQMLAGYIAQGMYVFGEAMSPSLCYSNAFLDCRTNVSWFDPAQLAWHAEGLLHIPPPDIYPSNWSGLRADTWVHGLDIGLCDAHGGACWQDLTWGQLEPDMP